MIETQTCPQLTLSLFRQGLPILQWTAEGSLPTQGHGNLLRAHSPTPQTLESLLDIQQHIGRPPSIEGSLSSPFPSVQTFPVCPFVPSPGLGAKDPEMSLNLPSRS